MYFSWKKILMNKFLKMAYKGLPTGDKPFKLLKYSPPESNRCVHPNYSYLCMSAHPLTGQSPIFKSLDLTDFYEL